MTFVPLAPALDYSQEGLGCLSGRHAATWPPLRAVFLKRYLNAGIYVLAALVSEEQPPVAVIQLEPDFGVKAVG